MTAKLLAHFYLTPNAASNRVVDPSAMGDDHGGGSRAGYLGLVRAMGRLGKYTVKAIGPFNQRQQTIGDVDYIRLDQAHRLSAPDIAHAYYDGEPLRENAARMRIWSHHTYAPTGVVWDWTDLHTTPSLHSLQVLKSTRDPLNRWAVVPNAVEGLDGIEWNPVPGRAIYHTTPDRGLHVLCGMWPEIRARVPGATLHVVGDVREFADMPVPKRSVRGRRAAQMRESLAAAQAAGGVTLLGRLARADLLRELSEANCFAFPASLSGPAETWSISVHECLHIGVPVILGNVDSLSMWDDYARVFPTAEAEFDASNRDHVSGFADELVTVLADQSYAQYMSERGKLVRGKYSFDKTAARLDSMISEFFAERLALQAS